MNPALLFILVRLGSKSLIFLVFSYHSDYCGPWLFVDVERQCVREPVRRISKEVITAKQRSGYVYEETIWYSLVEYKELSGKSIKIKRRAKGRVQATEITEQITAQLMGFASG